MTVNVREWKKGKQVGVEVDIRFTHPDGAPFPRRIKAPWSRSPPRKGGARLADLVEEDRSVLRGLKSPDPARERSGERSLLVPYANPLAGTRTETWWLRTKPGRAFSSSPEPTSEVG
jgi:hypothetical protein